MSLGYSGKTPRIRVKMQTLLWVALTLFVVIVLAALMVLEFFRFDSAYNAKEEETITQLGDAVAEEWRNVRFSRPASLRLYRGDATIRIFNRAGVSETSEVLQESDPDPLDAAEFLRRYDASGQMVYLAKVTDPKLTDSTYLVYGNRIENPENPDAVIYIYIFKSCGPGEIVKDILTGQMIGLAVFMIVLVMILSYFLSSLLARPLARITREASILAAGEYDVHFQRNICLEVDQLADTLNYTAEELARLDQVRDEVMASVSHDLRTPLTVIKAYAELLRDFSGAIPEKRREHVATILNEAEWMGDLVNEILEYSRVRYGGVEPELRPMDLAELTQTCIQDIHATPLGMETPIVFRAADVPEVVGDMNRIRRVIHNLISNAIKHSPEGEILEIGLEAKADCVRWCVTDYGSGISEDEQRLIWGTYYSKDSENKHQKSFGLGLSIVKGILEEHHAEYGIESRTGEGCRFWFELKRSDVVDRS